MPVDIIPAGKSSLSIENYNLKKQTICVSQNVVDLYICITANKYVIS